MRRRMIKENPKRHTKKQNRETRRNKKAESKGEKGQHTHTVTRIIFETVFVPANKGKTSIYSKNITVNRHLHYCFLRHLRSCGKTKVYGHRIKRKQRKAEEGEE
jgi:hypothetical protein